MDAAFVSGAVVARRGSRPPFTIREGGVTCPAQRRCARPRMVAATPPPRVDQLPRGGESPVKELDDWMDFEREVHRAEDHIMVVKFYAPWCTACKKVGALVANVADEYPMFKFCDFNFAKNREYCRELGIRAMPTFHFYTAEEGRLENFTCGPKRFPKLVTKLKEYQSGVCELSDHEDGEEL